MKSRFSAIPSLTRLIAALRGARRRSDGGIPAFILTALLGAAGAHARPRPAARLRPRAQRCDPYGEHPQHDQRGPAASGWYSSCRPTTIFAQPLYVPKVLINQVSHNVVYVATMNDTVYAFDAHVGGAPLWSVNLAALFGETSVPIGNFVFAGDRGIVGNLGVLSTPVIDNSTNTLYVVSCTLEGGAMVYRLHALDITSGATRTGSGVQIAGSYGGQTFNARYLLQRMSLALANNQQVVLGFSAMQLESSGDYSGWVLSYDKSTLTRTGIFATVPTGNLGGGVWQSGRPPVVDSAGFVYVFTGNGYGGGYDGVHDFSESALKLDSSNALALADWFTPSDWSTLDTRIWISPAPDRC